jgi:hypothetical protein
MIGVGVEGIDARAVAAGAVRRAAHIAAPLIADRAGNAGAVDADGVGAAGAIAGTAVVMRRVAVDALPTTAAQAGQALAGEEAAFGPGTAVAVRIAELANRLTVGRDGRLWLVLALRLGGAVRARRLSLLPFARAVLGLPGFGFSSWRTARQDDGHQDGGRGAEEVPAATGGGQGLTETVKGAIVQGSLHHRCGGRGRRDLHPGLAACGQSAGEATRAHDVRSLDWRVGVLRLGNMPYPHRCQAPPRVPAACVARAIHVSAAATPRSPAG